MKIYAAGQELIVSSVDVARYVKEHHRTARVYDLDAGRHAVVTESLIKATRVFSSRISTNQGTWFIKKSQTAPWTDVGVDDCLVDADPNDVGGLYDQALNLWNHFSENAIPGIASAKISKVLHAMRPSVFPVLDSRVRKEYTKYAHQVMDRIDENRGIRVSFWAAIRDDLIRSESSLNKIRTELLGSSDELVQQWASRVSDVRLHDVLIWSK